MPQYGEVRVDYITYTTGVAPNEGNVTVPVSGLVNAPTFSGDVIIEGDLEVNGDLTVSGDINASGVTISGFTGLFASGTVGSPSISFVDDEDTGIYSPAANQVAITTSGTGRLFVDASGKVGIGTDSPGQLLHILSDTQPDGGNVSGASKGSIFLNNSGGTTGQNQLGNAISFSRIDTSRRGAMIASYQPTADSDQCGLAFYTKGSTTTSTDTVAQRVVITHAGYVGIGTSSPGRKLHVVDSNNILRLESSSTTASRIEFENTASTSSDSVSLGSVSNDMQFVTSNSEKMRITSTGLVGIGTSSPGGRLDVQGGNIYLGKTVQGDIFFSDGNDTYLKGANNIIFQTPNGSNRLAIQGSTGNVGIGTTSPGELLQIGGTSDTAFGLKLSSGTQAATIKFDASGNVDVNNNLARALILSTSNSERARIDSSGRLLVGTSSATSNSLLQIKGNTASADAGGELSFQRGLTPTGADQGLGFIGFEDTSGNEGASIEAESEGAWTTGSSHPGRLVFSTTADGASSPTERMRIDKVGTHWHYGDLTAGIFSTNQLSTGGNAVLAVRCKATSATSGTNSFFVFPDGDVQNTNNSYGSISDIKLKENIVDANSQWDDIKDLQVRKYNFKEGQTHTQIGLIAQEVELVSPGLVSESPDLDEDGNDLGTVTKSVNYSVLYMKAVKALQEAMERIETLEAKVAALESA